MRTLAKILPPLAGLLTVALLLKWLGLDWGALARGDFSAASEALRGAAEHAGALKVALILGLAAVLPFVLVPITVVLFSAALVLPPLAAVPVILGGALLNTALAYAAGLLYGRRLLELLGLERFGFFQVLKAGARSHGFQMALLSRCIPSPFAIQAMAAATLGIRFWQMMLGTGLAMLPWALIYVSFPEALRRGDFKLLGPLLAALAALAALAWWARARFRAAAGAQAEAPARPEPLSPQVPPLGPELTFYTLAGDPACDEARRELIRLRPLLGFEVREVEIGSQPGLAAQIGEHLPVLMLDGEKLFSFQVDENLLKLRLKK